MWVAKFGIELDQKAFFVQPYLRNMEVAGAINYSASPLLKRSPLLEQAD